MYREDVHKELRKHDLPVWKLCKELNISRSHFYDLSHDNFKGHEKDIQNGLDKLIDKADKKAGAVHAD